MLTVTRLLAPVVVPLVYRAAIAARGFVDERRADRLGVPLSQIGQFSGHGAQLSARIAGAEQSLRLVAEKKPKDAETKQFVAAMTERLSDLSAAVTAAENMPVYASPGRARRDRRTTRRHRRRPDGAPRPGLIPDVPRPTRSRCSRLRGTAAGLLTAALAVAAHGVGSGAPPTGAATAQLAVLAATVGALAADHPPRHRHAGAAGSAGRRSAARAPAAQCGRPQPRARRGAARCGDAGRPPGGDRCRCGAHCGRRSTVPRGGACGTGRRANRLPAGAGCARLRYGCRRSAAAFGASACGFGVTSGSAGQPRPLTGHPNDTRKPQSECDSLAGRRRAP